LKPAEVWDFCEVYSFVNIFIKEPKKKRRPSFAKVSSLAAQLLPTIRVKKVGYALRVCLQLVLGVLEINLVLGSGAGVMESSCVSINC
jgi:hypothetical protein